MYAAYPSLVINQIRIKAISYTNFTSTTVIILYCYNIVPFSRQNNIISKLEEQWHLRRAAVVRPYIYNKVQSCITLAMVVKKNLCIFYAFFVRTTKRKPTESRRPRSRGAFRIRGKQFNWAVDSILYEICLRNLWTIIPQR